MSTVEELTHKFNSLRDECESIERESMSLDRKIEDAALDAETGGNRKAYDALIAKRKELSDNLTRKIAARTAVQTQLSEAKAAKHEAERAERERIANAICAKRTKFAAKAQEYIDGLAKVHADMFDLGREAFDEFHPTLGTRLNGTAIHIGEWFGMLENELARVSSPGILPPSTVPPALPGSRTPIFGGSPAKAPTLTEAMAAANAELLRRVTAAPAPAPKTVKHVAPAAAAPSTTAETPDNQPRVDGTQIVRPRVRMAV